MELYASGQADELADFAKGVDLFVIDAMFTDEQAERHRGWGHSSWREALEGAQRTGVRETALFHHDPKRDDDTLAAMDNAARAVLPSARFVRQGNVVSLGDWW